MSYDAGGLKEVEGNEMIKVVQLTKRMYQKKYRDRAVEE